jgi:hypothetical protein
MTVYAIKSSPWLSALAVAQASLPFFCVFRVFRGHLFRKDVQVRRQASFASVSAIPPACFAPFAIVA